MPNLLAQPMIQQIRPYLLDGCSCKPPHKIRLAMMVLPLEII